MSIKCKYCDYKLTTFGFLGHMTAEIFLLLQKSMQTRGITVGWSHFMSEFSNKIKIPCAMCQKTDYCLPEDVQVNSFVKSQNIEKGESHVK